MSSNRFLGGGVPQIRVDGLHRLCEDTPTVPVMEKLPVIEPEVNLIKPLIDKRSQRLWSHVCLKTKVFPDATDVG